MSRVRRFCSLSASEQLLLVVTGVLFGVFWTALRAGSLSSSVALARWLAGVGLSRWPVERVDWALSVVESSRPGSGGCLPAALVGLAVSDDETLELQIGVRKTGGSLEAHAWLKGERQLLYAGENPAEFQRLEKE